MKISITQAFKNTFAILTQYAIPLLIFALLCGLLPAIVAIKTGFERITFVTSIVTLLLIPAFIFLSRDWHEKIPTTFSEGFMEGIKSLLRLMFASFLLTLLYLFAIFVLGFPVFYYITHAQDIHPVLFSLAVAWLIVLILAFFISMIRLMLFLPVYLIEKKKFFESIKRSFALTQNNNLKISLIYFLIFISVFLFLMLIYIPIVIIFPQFFVDIEMLIDGITSIPFAIAGTIITTCVYYQLREDEPVVAKECNF